MSIASSLRVLMGRERVYFLINGEIHRALHPFKAPQTASDASERVQALW